MNTARILAGMVVATAVVTAAMADDRSVVLTFFGGAGFTSHADFHDLVKGDIEDAEKALAAGGAFEVDGGVESAPIGLGGGLEIVKAYNNSMALGIRGGISIATVESHLNYGEFDLVVPTDKNYSETVMTFGFVDVPLLAGARFSAPLNEHVAFRGGVFLGAVLVSGDLSSEESTYTVNGLGQKGPTTVTTLDVPYSGAAPAGEVLLGASTRLSDALSLGIDVGYRFAKTGLAASEDVDVNGDGQITPGMDIQEGDKYKDAKGKAVEFDAGGVSAFINLTFHL